MLINEIYDTVGRNDYHPESFYAPIVAEFIQDEGTATWTDIYAYVELMLGDEFTAGDLTNVPSRPIPRWKVVVNNLHQHRTLEGGKFGDIVRIKNGFAMQDVAEEKNIPILPDNNVIKKDPGNRDPKNIKKKTGIISATAYKEMNSPKLDDTSNTRKDIEQMISKEPWLIDDKLIVKAKEIITSHMV